MREDVLASAGAQDTDYSGYELSDLSNIDVFWQNLQMELDVVLTPGKKTLFWPTACDDLQMGGSSENPSVLDEEEDK